MFPMQYPHVQPPLFSGPITVGRQTMYPPGSSGNNGNGTGSAPSTPPMAPANPTGGGGFLSPSHHHLQHHSPMMMANRHQVSAGGGGGGGGGGGPGVSGNSPLLMSAGPFPNIMFPCLPQPQPLFSYPAGGHHSDRSRGTTPSGDSEGSSRLASRTATQAKKSRRRQLDRSPAKMHHGPPTSAAAALELPTSGPQSMHRSPAPKIMTASSSGPGGAPSAASTAFRQDGQVRVVVHGATPPRQVTPPPAPMAFDGEAEMVKAVPPAGTSQLLPSDGQSAAAAVSSVPPGGQPTAEIKELDEHRIAQRMKQINFGKVTDGYRHYRHAVPQCRRQLHNPRHPETPDVRAPCSKRKWDQEVAVWRRSLHQWDNDPDPATMRDPECNHYYTHHAEMSMEEYLKLTQEELQRVHDEVARSHGSSAPTAATAGQNKKGSEERRVGCDAGNGFCSATAGETEVSNDEHSAPDEARNTKSPSPTRQHAAQVNPLDDALLSRGATPKWELGCAMFDYSPPAVGHTSRRAHHRSSSVALSPIRPTGNHSTSHHQPSYSSPVRTTISWSESRCPDVPRIRIPVNYHQQGCRVRPFVLVMDGTGEDPVPIYEKLCATFQLEHLYVEAGGQGDTPTVVSSSGAIAAAGSSTPTGSSPSGASSSTSSCQMKIDSVEQVMRLVQQGKRHDMVLSLPKLTYRGELVHPRSHFFEQIDDIQREMLSMTPTSHRQILASGGAPTTPDRLTFTVGSGSAVQRVFTPSMSAVKVSTTPHSFCFQPSSFGGVLDCPVGSLATPP